MSRVRFSWPVANWPALSDAMQGTAATKWALVATVISTARRSSKNMKRIGGYKRRNRTPTCTEPTPQQFGKARSPASGQRMTPLSTMLARQNPCNFSSCSTRPCFERRVVGCQSPIRAKSRHSLFDHHPRLPKTIGDGKSIYLMATRIAFMFRRKMSPPSCLSARTNWTVRKVRRWRLINVVKYIWMCFWEYNLIMGCSQLQYAQLTLRASRTYGSRFHGLPPT